MKAITLEEYQKTLENYSNMTKTNSKGIITYVTPEFCKLLGYTQEELIGQSHNIIRHPDTKEEEFQRMWKTILAKKTYSSTIKNLTKPGETLYLKTFIYPILDKNSEIEGFISTRFNITKQILQEQEEERKEKELLESNRRLTMAQKIAKLGYWTLHFKDNTLEWSEQIFDIFEIDQDKFGASYEAFLNLVHPDDKELVNQTFQKSVEEKTPYNIVHRLLMPDGRIKWVEENGETNYDEEGNPICTLGLVQDITKRYENELKIKEQEKTLQFKSKMETMGEMIEMVAHQWRQPLSIITTIASGMKLNLTYKDKIEKDKLIEHSEQICETAHHLSSTIDDFRYFFKNSSEKSFDLKQTVLKTVGFLNLDVDVQKNLVLSLESIEHFGLENQMIHVLMNILSNAKYQLEQDKRIKGVIKITLFEKEQQVYLEITDSGGGIPDDIIDNVFVNRFTTKDEGSGLGLSMSKDMIENSFNGQITASNVTFEYTDETYKGAKFLITFPLLNKQ